jgi:acetyl-CoA carboxylase biotin carboxyl carrier protein
LNDAGLAELEYAHGEIKVRLTKFSAAPSPAPLAAAPPPNPATWAGDAPAAEAPADVAGLLTSPMVGVAYTSPEPDAPAFISVGEPVSEGDTVMLIEAMKVFNPIKAHRTGRVTKIHVGNGTPVEYGEPLLVIE